MSSSLESGKTNNVKAAIRASVTSLPAMVVKGAISRIGRQEEKPNQWANRDRRRRKDQQVIDMVMMMSDDFNRDTRSGKQGHDGPCLSRPTS
jgi:hypothetical protein